MNVCWCRQHEHGDDCHEALAGCVLLPFLRLFVPLRQRPPGGICGSSLPSACGDGTAGTNAALAPTLPACASLERQASELLICWGFPSDIQSPDESSNLTSARCAIALFAQS